MKLKSILQKVMIFSSLTAVSLTAQAGVESADQLLDKAEIHISKGNVISADQSIKEALMKEPANARAKLWSALLAPTLEMRGFYARVTPYVASHPNVARKYNKAVKTLMKSNNQELISFYMLGPQDISTEFEFQEAMARVAMQLDNLRVTLQSLKLQEIKMNLPVFNSRGEVSLQPTRLNMADLEVAQHAAAGAQIYLTAVNSYSLDGAGSAYEKLTQEQRKSKSAVVQAAKDHLQNSSFGRLRQGHVFGVVPKLAKDFILGYRYALQNQKLFCPGGRTAGKPAYKPVGAQARRPGYLISDLCVLPDANVTSAVNSAEAGLNGNLTTVTFNPAGPKFEAVVNIQRFLNQPLERIQDLGEISTDEKGNITAVADDTLNGLLPNHDLNSILKQLNQPRAITQTNIR